MTDTAPSDDRSRKERSPSFPFISLSKAVDRARAVAEAHKRSPARLITVGETWGYAPQSSGLLQTAAALKGYGLMEDIGKGQDRRVQLTDLAWRILHDTRPGAREQAIREAALRPRLFAEYAGEWLPERPSDNHCVSELHLDRNFTQGAAELFLRVFDETVAFANLKESDSLSASSEEPETVMQAAESVKDRSRSIPAVSSDWVPYSVTFTPAGLKVIGSLNDVASINGLIRVLEAGKLLLGAAPDVKRDLAKDPE